MNFRPGILVLCLAVLAPTAAAEAGTSTPLEEAYGLIGHILTDGSISDEEKALLAKLQAATAPIELELDGSPQAFRVPDAESKALLGFFHTPMNLNDLWLADAAKTRLFVHIAAADPATYDRLTNFAASKFHAAWQQSSIDNGYGPVRDLVMEWFNAVEPLGGEDARIGRQLGYDAMLRVDTLTGDAVPDLVYDWIKPAG